MSKKSIRKKSNRKSIRKKSNRKSIRKKSNRKSIRKKSIRKSIRKKSIRKKSIGKMKYDGVKREREEEGKGTDIKIEEEGKGTDKKIKIEEKEKIKEIIIDLGDCKSINISSLSNDVNLWFKVLNHLDFLEQQCNCSEEKTDCVCESRNKTLINCVLDIIKKKMLSNQNFKEYNHNNIRGEGLLSRLIEFLDIRINDSDPIIPGKYDWVYAYTFGYNFNQALGDSLDTLTNLKSLTFDYNFNNGGQPLGDSLAKLTNLKSLTFGYNFNQPLGDSLDTLTNLKSLTFGYNFNQPLGDSLAKLTNLESLTFGYNFNKPLGDSLDTLTKLESLTFDVNFGQPLADSLNKLKELKKIVFSTDRKMIHLDNIFDKITALFSNVLLINLPKLKSIHINYDPTNYSSMTNHYIEIKHTTPPNSNSTIQEILNQHKEEDAYLDVIWKEGNMAQHFEATWLNPSTTIYKSNNNYET